MRVIVGLGNPGPQYALTPHNAGFLAIDRIAEGAGVMVVNRRGKALTATAQVAGESVLLAKPETFMNLSGLSVAALVRELDVPIPGEGLIVLYDELAFPLGELRIRERGSANGHNGVKSISGALGTEEWLRVRIGIGKPALPDGREVRAGGAGYLLTPMRKTELGVLDRVLDRARDAVDAIILRGAAAAMSEFNGKGGKLTD